MATESRTKVLCIGAGAIGLLAGGSAAAQGAAVTFLVKPGQESKLAGKEIHIQNQSPGLAGGGFRCCKHTKGI